VHPLNLLDANGSANFQVLLEDGERVFCRVGSHANADGSVLDVLPAAEHPTPATLNRLAHEYGFKDELNGAWAARPLELIRDGGRTMLVLEDPGGEPLERLLGVPFEMDLFLRLGNRHQRSCRQASSARPAAQGYKARQFMVNCADRQVRLTGFGIASRCAA